MSAKSEAIYKQFSEIGIIPVVVLNDAKDAEPLGKALMEGGLPAAEVTFAINFTVTAINAAVSLVITVLLYLALRVPLKKAGLFFRLR